MDEKSFDLKKYITRSDKKYTDFICKINENGLQKSNVEEAQECFQIMKHCDQLGNSFEKSGNLEIAYYHYKISLELMKLYDNYDSAEDVFRHISICYMTLARVSVLNHKAEDAQKHYREFLSATRDAILCAEDEHQIAQEVNELFKNTETIIKAYSDQSLKEKIQFIDESINFYDSLKNEGIIPITYYNQLKLQLEYAKIVLLKNYSDKVFENHLELIEKIIENKYDTVIAGDIFNQAFNLLNMYKTPKKFKAYYRKIVEEFINTEKDSSLKIKIFISSNFSEFHNERDILLVNVKNRLNQYCEVKYNKSIDMIDLRWGIHVSDSSDQKEAYYRVLSLCEKNITESEPFFVLFLGDKAGTYIEKEILDSIFPKLELDGAYSITEIEYMVRKKLNNNLNQILVMNKSYDNTVKEKEVLNFVSEIKKEIQSENIIEYKDSLNSKEIEEMLFTKLKFFIDESNVEVSCLSKEENRISSLGKKMIGFEEEKNSFDYMFNVLKKNIIAISGEKGSGKSTFLGNIYNDLKEREIVFVYDEQEVDIRKKINSLTLYMLSSIAKDVGYELPKKQLNLYGLVSTLKDVLTVVNQKMKYVFIVDDYHLLRAISNLYGWFNIQDFPNLYLVLAINDNSTLHELLSIGSAVIPLKSITLVFDKYAYSKFYIANKNIDSDLLYYMFTKAKDNNGNVNPLMLTLLINRIVYLDSTDFNSLQLVTTSEDGFSDKITKYQIMLISTFSDSVQEYLKIYIKSIISENDTYKYIFGLLAFKGIYGVSIKEIHELSNILKLDNNVESFVDLRHKFSEFIIFDSHDVIKTVDLDLIKIIFELIDKDVLDKVSSYIIQNESISYVNFDYYLDVLLYKNILNKIFAIFNKSDYHIQMLIIRKIIEHNFNFDLDNMIFDETKIDADSVSLLRNVIVNDLHSKYIGDKDKSLKYCDIVINRFDKKITKNIHEVNLILISLIHSFELKHSNNIMDTEQFQEYLNKWFELYDRFDIQNYFYVKFTRILLAAFWEYEFDGIADIYTELLTLFISKYETIYDLDTYFQYLYCVYYSKKLSGPMKVEYIDNILERYKEHIENFEDYDSKIDVLFFLAQQYNEIEESEKKIQLCKWILDIYKEDTFFMQYNYKHTTIKSTVSNYIGTHYYNMLLSNKIAPNEKKFLSEKEEKDYTPTAMFFLEKSAYYSQSIYNADGRTLSTNNYHISSMNYAIFLLVMTDDHERVYKFIISDYLILVAALNNGQNVIERYIIAIMYICIIEKYFNVELLNMEKAFVFLESNFDKFKEYYYDIDFILESGDSIHTLFETNKSEEYIQLVIKIKNLLKI